MAAINNRASFNIQLQGYTPANKDAVVRLVNEVTGQVVERKPFLDGSLLVRDLEPGPYQLEVRHPNLIQPIDNRRIRLFPQLTPTFVPVPVRAELFRDSPIRDIPDADLTPVQQTSDQVKRNLAPIQSKAPGEAIRASDWNTLAGAVVDLSNAMMQLTQLVSPKGHDHSEIAEKINEVQGNIRRFADAFGKSLLELRREIETESLRRNITQVLDAGKADPDLRGRVLDRVTELERGIQTDPTTFTEKLARAGGLILTEINTLATNQGADADQFRAKPEVQQAVAKASTYYQAGTQTRPEGELQVYGQSAAVSGGTKFLNIVKQ